MPTRAGGPASLAVLRLSSFGDVVLAEPVTRRLKQAYPDCRIYFATHDEYREIPALFACVDAVITYPRGPSGVTRGEGIPAEQLDAVIDLQNSARSRLVAAGLRAHRVLRYRRQYVRRFLAVYLPWIWRGDLRHTIDLYFDALRPLGVKHEGGFPTLCVPADAAAAVPDHLAAGGFIGVCPGAGSIHKMWGSERFGSLISLLERQGHRVLVAGSARDRNVVDSAAAGHEGGNVVKYVAGSVTELAAALALCPVTVGNDSGLLHLAAGVGSSVVSVWGPTHPLLGFAPRAPGAAVVSRNLACSPCSYHGNRPCRYARMKCFEDIEPGEVASLVSRVVRERGNG